MAEALRDWIVLIIQSIDPWMSSIDLQPGSRWNGEVARELEASTAGIICLTSENLNEPWLLFEAGALAKTVDRALVVPYLLDIAPTDVQGPLAQFQGVRATKAETWKLVVGLHRALGTKTLSEIHLRTTFDRFWPDLAGKLDEIRAIKDRQRGSATTRRTDRELLEESVHLLRNLQSMEAMLSSAQSQQPPLGAHESSWVLVDMREIGSSEEMLHLDPSAPFQSFLDRLYSHYLDDRVPAFTYGKTWALERESGDVIAKDGVRDSRSISQVGLRSGERLRLRLLLAS